MKKEAVYLLLEFCERIYKEKEDYRIRLSKEKEDLNNYIHKSLIELKIQEIQEEFKNKCDGYFNEELNILCDKYKYAEEKLRELLEEVER